MLLGTREPFAYVECSTCGCVQIETIPDNLASYYPSAYFSFRDYRKLARAPVRRLLDKYRFGASTGKPSVVGTLANRLSKPLDFAHWANVCGFDQRARVLDIGCGSGKLLLRMKLAGFDACTGVDPFLDASIDYPNGLVIHATPLTEFAAKREEHFDLIMLHHSLEHVSDQDTTLGMARQMLADGGNVLIRIPVADSFAFREYREHWYNLDAPRHLYLHTQKSLAIVADRAGLKITRVEFDSTPSQFLGSELYRQDIAANEASPEREAIEAERAQFADKTARLNEAGDGDMAVFYLEAA